MTCIMGSEPSNKAVLCLATQLHNQIPQDVPLHPRRHNLLRDLFAFFNDFSNAAIKSIPGLCLDFLAPCPLKTFGVCLIY